MPANCKPIEGTAAAKALAFIRAACSCDAVVKAIDEAGIATPSVVEKAMAAEWDSYDALRQAVTLLDVPKVRQAIVGASCPEADAAAARSVFADALRRMIN